MIKDWLKIILFIILTPLIGANSQSTISIYRDPSQPVDKRVEDLISKMTLNEKIDLLSGNRMETKSNERLGIPFIRMSDGPVGVRIWGSATAFPASIAMGSSWDKDLLKKIGAAIAREAKHYGINLMLAPATYITRVPHGGRNFEGYGEDPYLASKMTVSYVNGMHDEGIIAEPKPIACNNQEFQRRTVNAVVDERTLHEIYLPAYKASVQEAGCWAIMSAYNKVNGYYCSENRHLLTDILKEQWGFPGFVISDWGAVQSTVGTIKAGCDLEMPLPKHLSLEKVNAALTEEKIDESDIDESLQRIFRAMFSMGFFDQDSRKDDAIDTKAHRQLALAAARSGIVLLKNENKILPLDKHDLRSIVLIGPSAKIARYGGGGSSKVHPFFSVSPLQGFRQKVGDMVDVRFEQGFEMKGDIFPIEPKYFSPPNRSSEENGLLAEYYDNASFAGEPVLKKIDSNIDFDWQFRSPATNCMRENFSVRWTGYLKPGETATYILSLRNDDNMKFFMDDSLVLANTKADKRDIKSTRVRFEKDRVYALRIEYDHTIPQGWDGIAVVGWKKLDTRMFENAVDAAATADIAVLFAGYSDFTESEQSDRAELTLPPEQVRLIQAVSRANEKTIVVLHNGAQILMEDWLDGVNALLEAWYSGQECGNAIANIIFGDVNPSGRLPMTFMKRWEDHSAFGNYPGENGKVRYQEGIFMGYRHFDKYHIEPLFPFGYGLSYTTFQISDIKLSASQMKMDDEITVNVLVKNTGDVAGAHVVQFYIQDVSSSVDRPVKELKGFERVTLNPDETKTVQFSIKKDALSYYDVQKKAWVAEPGMFKILVGSSSRDIQVSDEVELVP